MLELLNLTRSNIIATKANDLMGLNDYEKIHPFIHNILESGKKVRWYFEMDIISFSGEYRFWEDAVIEIRYKNLKFKHSEDFERIAIVGHEITRQLMLDVMRPFKSALVKFFDLKNKEDAEKWIAA